MVLDATRWTAFPTAGECEMKQPYDIKVLNSETAKMCIFMGIGVHGGPVFSYTTTTPETGSSRMFSGGQVNLAFDLNGSPLITNCEVIKCLIG
jgi:hypothetical protein